MHGLNEYDFSARWQDAAIMGFTTMDPLAEQTPWNSPYAYCSNDPVNRVDPMGMDDHLNNNNLGGVTVTGHNPNDHRQDDNSKDANNYANYWSNDHSNPNSGGPLMGDGSSNDSQSSTNESSVPVNTDKILIYGESDPDSNYGPDGSYNLYTQNETNKATKVMFAIGTARLTIGTGAAAVVGDVALTGLNKIGVITGAQVVGGVLEGSIKSIFGPDTETSSSIFMNPISDAWMNATEVFWNGWTISKGGNPLPNP